MNEIAMSKSTVTDLKQLSSEIQLLKEENRHLKQLLFENLAQKHQKDRSTPGHGEDSKGQLHVPHTTCSDPSSCNSTQSLMSHHSSSGFDDPQHFSSDNETGLTKPSSSYKKRFMKKRLKDRDKKRSKSLDVETLLPTRVQPEYLHQYGVEEVERSNSIGARRLAPILTITVPSTEEIYQSDSLSTKDEQYLKDKSRDISRTASIDMSVACSKPSDDLRMCHSAPSSPKKPINFLYDQGKSDRRGSGGDDMSQHSSSHPNKNTIHEIQKHYRLLQKRLSQEFSKKIGEWDMNRIRHPLSSCRGLSLPCKDESHLVRGVMSENLSPDFKKKLEEWNKMKCADQIPQTPHTAPPHFKKLIPDWQKWKSMNFKHELFTSHDLGSNEGPSSCQSEHVCSQSEHKAYRVTTGGGKCVQNIAWIDKEIHKIEREKQRLDKEKEKCEKKIQRLEKMRLAIGSRIRMKEVLIPTSSGLLRFPGISRKFTQKLYEWEKAQGIGPEASTFALLDSSYQPDLKERGKFKANEKRALTRSRSLGSVHDTTKGISRQPSSLSLNDMDELQDSNVNGADVLCSGDHFSHHSSGDDETKNLSPTSWTTDCLQTLQELFFDLEELEEIECDFSTLKSNLLSNKEEMVQITDQLQEYLSDTDKLFNDTNNELKLKIRGLQQRKDDLFREEAEMQILYITYCNKMINLSEKQVSDTKYMKHISDNILTLGLSPHENQKCASRSALENQTRPFVSSVCCVENEDQIAGFVSQKASQLIHYAKDIRDILKQSEQKLYRNYSNAMESESLQECIHNFNQLSCAMKTDIVRMKEYLIPYSPGFKEDSPVFKFDNVPGSEDSMDEPMVEFLKGQSTKESAPSTELPNISDNVQHVADKTITIHLNEAKLNSTGIQNKSSSEFSNEEGTDKKSISNLARKQKKKLRRRRKSDLKRQNSFDKGDDEMNLEGEHIVSTSDDELARTREPKQHKDPVFDTSSHVSLSDLVHLSDGSPVLESKFKLNSVTTEPGKVCVPTVRKIFTPVVDDCNGSPHVVGYVLRSAIEKETNEEPKVTEMSNKQNSDDVNSKCLDLNNSLEYIDKSDENDVDKVSNSSLQVESNDTLPPRDKEIQNGGKAEESLRMTENSKSDVKKHSSKDLTKQNETDKSENSKIKSIIEKYNKLTSVQNDEAVTTPIKTNKAPSNKIKELTEVFDTDASSKHSSQEISAPVQDENIPRSQKLEETPSDDSRTKDSIELPKSPLTRDSIPHNTSDTSLASEKLQSIPPHIPSEDYKNYRRHKTKLQLAKEEFLSNMACTSSHLDNINTVEAVGTIAADPNHTDTTKPNPHVKPVQKSFSSGMINTLSNSYGKLNKEEATKSNDSHVKAKKKTKSFREKFSTFRLKFKKPKSDKNLLDVGDSCGLSLDTGINNGASDVSARTSTHSIASNCSKSSSWRRFFDR